MQAPTRILLIEDDQVDRLACRRAFARQSRPFEFIETDSGREGVQLAHTQKPNCILLDYRLPDMNGLEVLAELAAGNGSLPPVVMLTGANDVTVAVEAMRLGARDYLLKDTERRYLELLPPIVERALQEQRVSAEKQQAETALAHAHRVMTAGELATALAHELNQPLAAITTFCEACLQQIQRGVLDQNKLRYNIEQISLQAQRAGEVIRELRAFLAKGETNRRAIDLNALVRTTRDLVAAQARARGVNIALELAKSLSPVLAAPVHVEHVLLNLLQNAIDAIHGAGMTNGSITLSTRKIGDGMAQISVRDTGPGFDAATAQHIFEPFFTTKTQGLGMGLAISRTIVKTHEGKFWTDATPGAGATFHFTLPFAA